MNISESFRARADLACYMEAYVAGMFARNRLYVLHAPLITDPTEKEREALMYHTSDLCLMDPTDPLGEMYPVEVKSTSGKFHRSPDGILVCSQASFDRKYGPGKTALPVMYAYISAKSAEVVCIPSGVKLIKNVPWVDRTRNESYEVVVAKCTSEAYLTVAQASEVAREALKKGTRRR